MDKANARLRALKRQLEEAEEENSKLQTQKRKIQREMEEHTEQNEALTREVEQLRTRMRLGGGDKGNTRLTF